MPKTAPKKAVPRAAAGKKPPPPVWQKTAPRAGEKTTRRVYQKGEKAPVISRR
jgi:hypothetical protein